MSKIMKRLEKLNDIHNRGANIKARAMGLQAESQVLDDELGKWLQEELGLSGQHHISEILKVALETSIEPKPKIITP